MNFTFSLSQNDYLQYYLYSASKNERMVKQRIRSRFINSGLILIMSVYFYQEDKQFLFYYFLAAGILMYFVYPIYMRWFYKRHYNRFVSKNYKDSVGKSTNVSINETEIISYDETGETKVNLSELYSIVEINDLIFMNTNDGSAIIIPKKQINNFAELKNELQNISQKFEIPFDKELSWEWK